MAGGLMNMAILTLLATSAVTRGKRVKFTAGTKNIEHAGLSDAAIGIAEDDIAAGERGAVRLLSHPGTLEVTAAGAFSLGAVLYGAAAGNVDDVEGGSGDRYLCLEAATGAGAKVKALFLGALVASSLVYSIQADGTNYTTSTVETTMGSVTLDGTGLKAGDVLIVEGNVETPSTNSTDTLTVKGYIGAVEIFATAAVDVANGDIGYFRMVITVEVAGVGGSVRATGLQALGVPGTVTAKPFRKGSTAIDLSAAAIVAIKGTWSVSHADNDANIENLVVQILRK